jgi:hypothetical protein
VRKADRSDELPRVEELVYGTGTIFLAAGELIAAAVAAHQLSPACAVVVWGFLTEVQTCVYSLVPVE